MLAWHALHVTLAEWARRLDELVLGRPVPDTRAFWKRLAAPRPALWSVKGKLLNAALLLTFFSCVVWGPRWLGTVMTVPFFTASFVITTRDERQRAREYYEQARSR